MRLINESGLSSARTFSNFGELLDLGDLREALLGDELRLAVSEHGLRREARALGDTVVVLLAIFSMCM